MHTDVRDTEPRADALSCRAMRYCPFRERLAIAALVAAVNLWIGMAQVIHRQSQPLVIRAQQKTP